MPGNVQPITDAALDQMPVSLCSAFTQSRSYEAIENIYRNGESQRNTLVDDERLSWKPSKRLTVAEVTELRAFYEAHIGTPFSIFDAFEADPFGDVNDAEAHFSVRFDGPWKETMVLGRTQVDIELIEVA